MKKKLKPSKTTTTNDSIGVSKARTNSRKITRRAKGARSSRRRTGVMLASNKYLKAMPLFKSSRMLHSPQQTSECSECPKIRESSSKHSQARKLLEERSKTPPSDFYASVNSPNPPPKNVLHKMHRAAMRFIHSRCYFCGEPSRLTRGVVEVEGHPITVYSHAACFPLDPST